MRKTAPMDRLTRDVLAAQAAGLSYGKYKALHPCTEEPEPEEVLPDKYRRVLICAFCGKTFVTDSKQAGRLYCDDECKQAAWTARCNARKQGQPLARQCALCGKEFEAIHGRLYCNATCRAEANRIRSRSWRRATSGSSVV